MNHSLLFRKLRSLIILATPFLLASLLCSCNNGLKLSNDAALQILNAGYKDFCNGYPKHTALSLFDHNFSQLEAAYDNLESMGLVMVKKETYRNGNSVVKITPTQKAIDEYNYISSRPSVAMAKLVPKEILGISINEEAKTADVVFIGEYETTPFIELSDSNGKNLCKPGQRFEKKAAFIHYDSGWRLKEPEEDRFPL